MFTTLCKWESDIHIQWSLCLFMEYKDWAWSYFLITKVVNWSLIVRVLEEQIMKFPNTLALKRIQLLKWGRRVASSSSAVTLGNIQRRAPVSCCHGSYVARQLVWRLKSLWKAAVKWQRSSIRYGYDAHSYSKNFDDGSFKDRPSPLVPKWSLHLLFFIDATKWICIFVDLSLSKCMNKSTGYRCQNVHNWLSIDYSCSRKKFLICNTSEFVIQSWIEFIFMPKVV